MTPAGDALRYALVTPVRNEAENLLRLAESVLAQTVLPERWVIVDNGSTDDTPARARSLAESHPWIELLSIPGEPEPERGAPIVRAFTAGLEALPDRPDVVVKLDADVSFPPDHFERLLARFAADPALGIASGICLERDGDGWRARHSTRGHVRGAVRAYRSRCLDAVLPLEPRMGWDGIDELKAATLGWRTATIAEIPFFHHRPLGGREPATRMWRRQGEMAHYLGYRPSYLVARALYRALREPSAVAMLAGYAASALRRRPRYEDAAVRAWLRREQSLRRLPARVREALGRPEAGGP